MEEVENLVKTTLQEIEKVLSTKTVVGEPLTLGDKTVIPLICAGFGFGAGGGTGKGQDKQGEGTGGGTGGGACVKPVAVIIVDKDGVSIEPIMGSLASALEKIGETLPKTLEKWWEHKKEE